MNISLIKKFILILAVVMPFVIEAQTVVGGWNIYSAFNGVDEIVETDNYVYYMSDESLFRVDKATYEVNSLTIANKLNDMNISGIYGNPDGKSIMVAYSSGNIDRLYDDGKIVNMSEIKDAIMSKSRSINDIAFGKDNFYVATDFGLVTFNSSKNEVRETAYSDTPIQKVFAMGNIVGIFSNNILYFARQSDRLNSIDKFKVCSNYSGRNSYVAMKGVGEKSVLLVHSADAGSLYYMTVDIDNMTLVNTHISSAAASGYVKNCTHSVRLFKDGVYAVNNEGIYSYDNQGNFNFISGLKEGNGNVISYYAEAAKVWIGSVDGLRYMDASNPDNMSEIQSISSESDMTVNAIHKIYVSKSGKVYIHNLGEHTNFGVTVKSPSKSKVNVVENEKFIDVSGVDVKIENTNGFSKTAPYFVNYSYNIYEDPTDIDAYYIGTFFEGLYRIKDGKSTHKYFATNSPLNMTGGNYGCCVLQPLVDNHGNLWVYKTNPGDELPHIFVLPADKRLSENTTSADWTNFIVSGLEQDQRDACGLVCNYSDYLVFLIGKWSKNIVFVNTKGTASLNDDTTLLVNRYIDQDNKELEFNHALAIAEDKNGRLWIGTNNGVFEITDPSKLTTSVATVNHLKVPRNDGTNLADYLLDSQVISQIAVDASNRKWISTIGSGVYLVSENGDEILEHYTIDNSILPSNTVYSVGCDPNSNKVYFGTASGLVEYNSTSAPGKENYSEVYAYPNPVRPEYTGWITVAGLMDDSLVKIADAAGNVIIQGRSDGSMFVWDGCNASGERVKSGVYYVMASQNATGSNSGCVTKIMVIN